MRYYYKTADGKSFLSLKSPIGGDYVEITEAEFAAHLEQVHQQSQPTEEQRAKAAAVKRIAELKHLLAESDYKAIKYLEGHLSAAEYAPVNAQRQSWRAEINRLESNL